MSATSMKELENQLINLVELSEHLRQLLEHEKDALLARDIAHLDTLVESKVAVQKQISDVETRLAADFKNLGYLGPDGRLDEAKAQGLSPAIESGLATLQQEALQCQQLMADNESIVNVNLTQVGQALNMLRREQTGEGTAVYTEGAQTEMHNRLRPEISVA